MIESSKRWWKCRNSYGQIGFVPFNILEPLSALNSPAEDNAVVRTESKVQQYKFWVYCVDVSGHPYPIALVLPPSLKCVFFHYREQLWLRGHGTSPTLHQAQTGWAAPSRAHWGRRAWCYRLRPCWETAVTKVPRFSATQRGGGSWDMKTIKTSGSQLLIPSNVARNHKVNPKRSVVHVDRKQMDGGRC